MNIDWGAFFSWGTISSVIDIIVVWYLVYNLFIIVKGTRAVHLMKGLAIIVAMKMISYTMQLHTLDWIMNQVIQWGVLAAVVIFQPEIRRGLEHLGRSSFFTKKTRAVNRTEQMIDELNTAVQYMAKRRIGALISIEQDQSLQEYYNTGIPVGASITSQLLINTFIPNTPLHDGAVIIRGYKLSAAACYLPLSESHTIPKELGTRHRAAIGLSEVTDAVTIVISEETGSVSITHRDQLLRDLSQEQFVHFLRVKLEKREQQEKEPTGVTWIMNFFKGGSHDE